jgi:hypothetical protein
VPYEKDSKGRIWVLLDPPEPPQGKRQCANRMRYEPGLTYEMRAHNSTLRKQLEAERQAHAEAMRIIERLVERIPPTPKMPSKPRESAGPGSSTSPPSDASEDWETSSERPEERSWWRRVFGA